MLKVITIFFGIVLRTLLSDLHEWLAPTVFHLNMFTHALHLLLVFCLNCDWFIGFFPLWLSRVIALAMGSFIPPLAQPITAQRWFSSASCIFTLWFLIDLVSFLCDWLDKSFQVNINPQYHYITYMERASSSLVVTVHHCHHTILPQVELHLKKTTNMFLNVVL